MDLREEITDMDSQIFFAFMKELERRDLIEIRNYPDLADYLAEHAPCVQAAAPNTDADMDDTLYDDED